MSDLLSSAAAAAPMMPPPVPRVPKFPVPPPVPVIAPVIAPPKPHRSVCSSREEAGGESRRALSPGTRLGRYTVIRLLGQGGFGLTYLCSNAEKGSRVVLKEHMPEGLARRDEDDEYVCSVSLEVEGEFRSTLQEFLEEVTILQGLHHPSIVPILDSFEANGTAYYVMPYIVGSPLELPEHISVDHAVQQREARRLRRLLMDLLDALAYLEQNNIVHRDIKPENIMLTSEGKPILLDFGSARQLSRGKDFTNIYTPDFCAPEQILTSASRPVSGELGAWTDIYALGATFYYLITRLLPARADMRFYADPDPYTPLAGRPELEAVYERAFLQSIDCALSLRRSRRWQSAGEWKKCIDDGMMTRMPGELRRVGSIAALSVAALAVMGVVTYRAHADREMAAKLYTNSMTLAEDVLMSMNDELEDMPGASEMRRRLSTRLRYFINSVESVPLKQRDALTSTVAAAWRMIADMYQSEGKFQESVLAVDKALALQRQMHSRHPEDAGMTFELSRTLLSAAESALRMNQMERCAVCTASAKQYLSSLHERDEKNPAYLSKMGLTLAYEAALAGFSGDVQKQRSLLEEMVETYRRLLREQPEYTNAERGLGLALQYLGAFYGAQEEYEASLKPLTESLNIFTRLRDAHPYKLSYLRGLAMVRYRLGCTYEGWALRAQGAEGARLRAQAQVYLSQFEEDVRSLLRLDPENREYQYFLCQAREAQVGVLLEDGKYNQVEAQCEAILGSLRRLLRLSEGDAVMDVAYHSMEARTWRCRALAYAAMEGHRSDALRAFQESIRIWEMILQHNPELLRASRELADVLFRYGRYFAGIDYPQQARSTFLRAEKILKDLEKSSEHAAAASRLLAQLQEALAALPAEENSKEEPVPELPAKLHRHEGAAPASSAELTSPAPAISPAAASQAAKEGSPTALPSVPVKAAGESL